MIGVLYRYPHPIDPTRFVYVGQGINRDKRHRSGRTSFGRRFKIAFPNLELPKPIKDQIEIESQEHLNWVETVQMFQYHTWRGYPEGMNLIFPGSKDYEILGKIGAPLGGRIGGQKAVESGQIHALGRKAVETGQLRDITTFETCSKGGKIGGAKNVKNGLFSYEHQSKAGKVGGKINGRKNVESGHIQSIGILGTHALCHVARGIKKDGCRLCYPKL